MQMENAHAGVEIRERGLDLVSPLTWEHTVWDGNQQAGDDCVPSSPVCAPPLSLHVRPWREKKKKAQTAERMFGCRAEQQLKTLPIHKLKAGNQAAQQVEIYYTGNFFTQVAPLDEDDTQPRVASSRIWSHGGWDVSRSSATAFITSRRLERSSRLDLITSNGTLYIWGWILFHFKKNKIKSNDYTLQSFQSSLFFFSFSGCAEPPLRLEQHWSSAAWKLVQLIQQHADLWLNLPSRCALQFVCLYLRWGERNHREKGAISISASRQTLLHKDAHTHTPAQILHKDVSLSTEIVFLFTILKNTHSTYRYVLIETRF